MRYDKRVVLRVRLGLWAFLVTAVAVMPVGKAEAFDKRIHRGITFLGLSEPLASVRPAVVRPYIRPFVLGDINDEHAYMDAGAPSNNGAEDQRHFDDCEFDGSAKFIRDRYGDARQALQSNQPFAATDEFGQALHTAEDFYAHSNWVELGFPHGTPPTLTDLVDLSGAQVGLNRQWEAPALAGVVRDGILLGGDDGFFSPGYSIDADGGGTHVPTLIRDNQVVGRLLVSGKGRVGHGGTKDAECSQFVASGGPFTPLPIFDGFSHEELNKDNPTADSGALHQRARDLATLQVGYEWCRLVRSAGLSGRDGLLLTTWVRPRSDPRPPNTPCAAPRRPGGSSVVVTILAVKVRDDRDRVLPRLGARPREDPGEIQLSAALYDRADPLRRFVASQQNGANVSVSSGQWVPADKLPRPLTLCVPRGTGATFALYGWDNDDNADDPLPEQRDYDPEGAADDLLTGFQVRFGADLPRGEQVAGASGDADLEVHYRVERTLRLKPPPLCQEDDAPSASPR